MNVGLPFRSLNLLSSLNRENLRARQIDVIVIVLLGKSLSYSMGMEEGTLKKQLEIDSKCLLTSQGGAEQLPALIKKLASFLTHQIEIHLSFFLELIK